MMTKQKIKKQNRTAPLIVVTTGGSGGHIFPAESIAGALRNAGAQIVFITDKRGRTFNSLPDISIYRLAAESVTGRSFLGKISAAFKLYWGSLQALFLLKKLKPALVIGVGGYASLPAVLAAHLWHIPVVLHEQNAVLGRANRVLAHNTRMIATSFNPTMRIPEGIPTTFVGLPAREQVLSYQNSPYPDSTDEFRLLIFGGSQGARFFSHKLPAALLKLPLELRQKISLVQQVRPEDMEVIQKLYQNAGFRSLTIKSFFNDMPELMAKCHLIIGRGGASTITEASIIGRPAIIIPLPTAADDHQTENARIFCDSGAGWLIAEHSFNEDDFSDRLGYLMTHPDILKEAGKQAYQNAKTDAAEHMASLVFDLIKGSR